ncbi:hypothetical protein ACHWQZ_G001942 [Mnemiopsis leidyi]
MAIFGAVSIRYCSETRNGTCDDFEGLLNYCKHRLRDNNDWDVFLNYFFAVLFMICFLVGITVNPLIILYHSKQKRTFAKVLFLLISIIDLIRSVYFPLVLVPKLLSPLKSSDKDDNCPLGGSDFYSEGDLYYFEPPSIYWTYHANTIISVLLTVQEQLLVTLCVSRYFTIRDPLSAAKKRIFVLCIFDIVAFICSVSLLILEYSQEKFGILTIVDTVISTKEAHEMEMGVTTMAYFLGDVLRCILLLVGGIFSGLTILHLKKSDTAACEASEKNVRKGILSIVAMNVFNLFVIIIAVCNSILITESSKKFENLDSFKGVSQWADFLLFAGSYGIFLTQSAFNSLSFLLICKSFRDFVKRIIGTRIGRVNIKREFSVNPTAEMKTTVM